MLETMYPPDLPASFSRAATGIRRSSPCAGAAFFAGGSQVITNEERYSFVWWVPPGGAGSGRGQRTWGGGGVTWGGGGFVLRRGCRPRQAGRGRCRCYVDIYERVLHC